MASNYTLDMLQHFVGKEVGVSGWTGISQELIDRFADVTGDRQWIHIDRERAALSEYGGTIAHGLLLLSLTYKLAVEADGLPSGGTKCVNYGYDRIRFPSPVRAGQRVRCHAMLKSVEDRPPDRQLITTRFTMEVEGQEKPALVADCQGLFYR